MKIKIPSSVRYLYLPDYSIFIYSCHWTIYWWNHTCLCVINHPRKILFLKVLRFPIRNLYIAKILCLFLHHQGLLDENLFRLILWYILTPEHIILWVKTIYYNNYLFDTIGLFFVIIVDWIFPLLIFVCHNLIIYWSLILDRQTISFVYKLFNIQIWCVYNLPCLFINRNPLAVGLIDPFHV